MNDSNDNCPNFARRKLLKRIGLAGMTVGTAPALPRLGVAHTSGGASGGSGGSAGSSVGTSNFITYTNLLARKQYATVALLLADTTDSTFFNTGDYVHVVEGGFIYKVAVRGDVVNSAPTPVQLNVVADASGSVVPDQFGVVGVGALDDTAIFNKAIAYQVAHGGFITVLAGNYSVALAIADPDVHIRPMKGVKFWSVGAASTFDIAATATGFTMRGPEYTISGQKQAQSGTTDVSGLHSIRVFATGVRLQGIKTIAARFDGIYCVIASDDADFECTDFELGDTCRLPLAIVNGEGYLFKRGYVWNSETYISAAGDKNYALADCEPNAGQKYRYVTFEDIVWSSTSTVSGANTIILVSPANGDASITDVRVTFIRNRFLNGATIRPHTGGAVISHITLVDCYHSSRVFTTTGSTPILEHIRIERSHLVTSNFLFGCWIGNGSVLRSITTDAASVATYNLLAGSTAEIYNCTSDPRTGVAAGTSIGQSNVVRSKAVVLTTTAQDLVLCGTRATYRITVSAGDSSGGLANGCSTAFVSVSNDYALQGATVDNAGTQIELTWKVVSGYSADARTLQARATGAAANQWVVKVEIMSSNAGISDGSTSGRASILL